MQYKMNKKLKWFEISLLLIPLSYLLYQIFSIAFGDERAGGLVFVLVLMSFGNFFYGRVYYNYYVLTILAYSGVSLVGATLMSLVDQEWMIIFLIFALHITKAITSTSTEYGEEIETSIEEEESQREGLAKLIASPTQREVNKRSLLDTVIFIVVGIVAFLAYDHFTQRYNQMNEYNKMIEERSK